LLLAAIAYTFARKHANDPSFSFGTGKIGDLAGFTSAIILAMISILIGYEAVSRLFSPVQIHFAEAIPIACLGLGVNIASAWLLSGGHNHDHSHGHSHGHGAAHEGHDHDETQKVETDAGALILEVFEDGVPPRFRLYADTAPLPTADTATIETVRPGGSRQMFVMADRGNYLESVDDIPEPHAFTANIQIGAKNCAVLFEEHEHADGVTTRDNNMRAAIVHVMADAAVSVLVIVGLILAKLFGWLWMDPLAGIVGAFVIASWAVSLIKVTGGILLDMNPDKAMTEKLRQAIESDGDKLADLHLWRLGPGHLGAIISVGTNKERGAGYYKTKLARFRSLSHLTIDVNHLA
jgi:cation diffusion facilitator family transporter